MYSYNKKREERKFLFIEQPTSKSLEQWWIKDVLPKRRLTLLSAMGGTGKTSLAAYWAKELAKNKGARIAYWSFEDSPQDFTNKIGKVDLLYFIKEEQDRPIDLQNEDDVANLNNFLLDNGIDILIVDPISTLLSGDTNDNQKVRALLNPLLQMTEDIELTILGIHHFRKPGKAGGGSARGNIMGASAWVDTARHVLSLVKNDNGQRFLEVVKSNIAPTGTSWEVETDVNLWGAFVVTGLFEAEEGSAQKALDEPEKKREAPVIKNLKNEFGIGRPFNLSDVDRLGNRKSFYNWLHSNSDKFQICENKKDGKQAYIFI